MILIPTLLCYFPQSHKQEMVVLIGIHELLLLAIEVVD